MLEAALKDCGDETADINQRLVPAVDVDTAWNRLINNGPFDLVISHWGYGLYGDRSNGDELLRRVARRRAEGTAVPPVVIFASGDHESENRRHALRLGAAEFVSQWEDLIALVERLLADTFADNSGYNDASF